MELKISYKIKTILDKLELVEQEIHKLKNLNINKMKILKSHNEISAKDIASHTYNFDSTNFYVTKDKEVLILIFNTLKDHFNNKKLELLKQLEEIN